MLLKYRVEEGKRKGLETSIFEVSIHHSYFILEHSFHSPHSSATVGLGWGQMGGLE